MPELRRPFERRTERTTLTTRDSIHVKLRNPKKEQGANGHVDAIGNSKASTGHSRYEDGVNGTGDQSKGKQALSPQPAITGLCFL